MALVFNPPPNWPKPPAGWSPTPTWRPDPAWGPVPEGWQLWIEEPEPENEQASSTRRALLRVLPVRSPRHRQALSRAVSLRRLLPRSSVPRRPFPNSLPSRKLPISRPLSKRLSRSLPTLRMRRQPVPSRARSRVSMRAHPVLVQRQALRSSRRCVPSRALLRLP